jgi:hypothetical protein
VKNLIEEAGKSQDHPTPRLVGRPWAAWATITSTGQWNHPPNSAAISVHLTARESAQCISAPDWTWACAWCLVSWNITPDEIY